MSISCGGWGVYNTKGEALSNDFDTFDEALVCARSIAACKETYCYSFVSFMWGKTVSYSLAKEDTKIVVARSADFGGGLTFLRSYTYNRFRLASSYKPK